METIKEYNKIKYDYKIKIRPFMDGNTLSRFDLIFSIKELKSDH